VATVARIAYEPITDVTDELLAMRWRSDAAARMWFTRRHTAPGQLGLKIVEDCGEYRVEPKPGPPSKAGRPPKSQPARNYDGWALEVDTLLIDANEPAEREKVLEALFAEGIDAGVAAQRIINRRARGLEVEVEVEVAQPSAESTPAVVGDTLADKAAAPTAESAPSFPVPMPKSVELRLFASPDMAPIVARRLSDITGASVEFKTDKLVRVDARDTDSGRR
jgi:hypothetical protein